MVHGAGSTVATARSLFEPMITHAIHDPIRWHGVEDRSGDVVSIARAIGRWVARTPPSGGPRLVCGISLGAHASALAAQTGHGLADHSPDGLILALPAWTGAPDATASITAHTGQLIATMGREATLETIAAQTPVHAQWLLEFIATDWERYSPDCLVQALSSAATGSAPTLEDLAHVRVPSLVIGAPDDPLHPVGIAREWYGVLPHGTFAHVEMHSHRGLSTLSTRTAVQQLYRGILSSGQGAASI